MRLQNVFFFFFKSALCWLVVCDLTYLFPNSSLTLFHTTGNSLALPTAFLFCWPLDSLTSEENLKVWAREKRCFFSCQESGCGEGAWQHLWLRLNHLSSCYTIPCTVIWPCPFIYPIFWINRWFFSLSLLQASQASSVNDLW